MRCKLLQCRVTIIALLILTQVLHFSSVKAQDNLSIVKGIVHGENNQPLINASVVIRNSQSNFTSGTKTDTAGIFTFRVPAGGPYGFTITNVGYEPQTLSGYNLKAGTTFTLDVSMKATAGSLEQVVVVGYGTQRRANVTGAIASVNATTITRAATPDATGALQGNVPGAVVVKNVGKPGSGYSINIRGISSFGGTNSPLFIIDGIPTTSGINDLNPADIEKIDILKDASATAIYGSRGAKGVVIVTTKRGKAGRTAISYDGYMGVRTPNNLPDMMNGPEYVAFRTQQFLAQGRDTSRSNAAFFTPQQWKNIGEGRFTDWPSLLLKDGLQMNHNVTASGGDEKTRFSLGAGILREEGNVRPEDFKRYSFRGNVDRQINEKWKAGISFYASQSLQNQGSYETLRSAYRLPPTVSPYDSTGAKVFRVLGGDGVTNPFFDQENDIRENRFFRTFGNLYIQVEPIRHLTLKTTLSPNVYRERTAWLIGSLSKEGAGAGGYTRATNNTLEQITWLWDNQAIYEREFGGVHKLTATAIQSLQKDRIESSGADVYNLPYNSLWYNLGSATNTDFSGTFRGPTVRSNFTKYTLASARGRINYSYKDKYLFTALGTWDGSSRLAEGNKWGFFPSASVKWRIAQEEFMQNITAVNDLSLRVSYGASGNDRVDAYSTQATLGSSAYHFGSALAQGYSPSRLANKELTWETTHEINVGVDFSLLKNRIYGTVDLYNRKIDNILLARALPAPSGWSSVNANIGKLRNQGIEVGLSTINIQRGKFYWKSDFVFDANKNEILETANGKRDDVGNRLFIGQPVQVNYDYVFDGIWQVGDKDAAAKYNQKPGQVRVKDIDNNGVINAADRQIIGKRVPDWTGSFANTFRYGNVDLYVLVYTRRGEQFNSVFDASFMNYNQIYKQVKVDYWTPENPSQTHFQPGNPGSFVNAAYYRKSDFIRVNNITLGYTFPNSLLQKVGVNSFRIYATALNPIMFTDYQGFDTEWTSQNTYGTAVSTASYLFGVNLSF
jgi:TonB-dependent starch-binding outer membrane protein SusC